MQVFVVVESNPDGTWLHKGFAKEKDANEYMRNKFSELSRRFLLDAEKPKEERHFRGWSIEAGGNVVLYKESINVKL